MRAAPKTKPLALPEPEPVAVNLRARKCSEILWPVIDNTDGHLDNLRREMIFCGSEDQAETLLVSRGYKPVFTHIVVSTKPYLSDTDNEE